MIEAVAVVMGLSCIAIFVAFAVEAYLIFWQTLNARWATAETPKLLYGDDLDHIRYFLLRSSPKGFALLSQRPQLSLKEFCLNTQDVLEIFTRSSLSDSSKLAATLRSTYALNVFARSLSANGEADIVFSTS